MEKVSVVLPTYNERENIARVITLIKDNYPLWQILVIDDWSPDGTSSIVEALAARYSNLTLFKREGERGRGLAGVYGFKVALEAGSDLIIEMDADMSHHPSYLKDIIREIENYDVVVGSRYIKGGRETGRPLTRRIVSRFANLYLRIVLGFSIHDWTSGYRCFRRDALSAIIPDVKSRGPSIVEEVLFKIKRKGFRIKEVPITFYEREKGSSKLNLKILFKTFLYSVYLRLNS